MPTSKRSSGDSVSNRPSPLQAGRQRCGLIPRADHLSGNDEFHAEADDGVRLNRTVEFIYPEVGSGRRYWWLVIEDGTVDLCGVDPGYDVDLHVRSSLRSMTAVWMGHSTLQREIDAGAVQLIGDKALARRMHEWLGLSSFAKEKRQVAQSGKTRSE